MSECTHIWINKVKDGWIERDQTHLTENELKILPTVSTLILLTVVLMNCPKLTPHIIRRPTTPSWREGVKTDFARQFTHIVSFSLHNWWIRQIPPLWQIRRLKFWEVTCPGTGHLERAEAEFKSRPFLTQSMCFFCLHLYGVEMLWGIFL